jgi:hypothetical protein
LRKAAEQGDAGAQCNLGVCYDCVGRGVEQDDAQAVAWYRKAAEQGHAGAQRKLGIMYGGGRGVEQDDAQAGVWYRKAAEQGDTYAQACIRGLDATDHEQLAAYAERAEEAVRGVANRELKQSMVRLQRSLVHQFCRLAQGEEATPAPGAVFAEMKELADAEVERLSALTARCAEKYASLTLRWGFVARTIQPMADAPGAPAPAQPDVPVWFPGRDGATAARSPLLPKGQTGRDDYLAYLAIRASWATLTFHPLLARLARAFNNAKFPEELGFGGFPLALQPSKFKLLEGAGLNTVLRCGPPKSEARMRAKVRGDYSAPGDSEHPEDPRGKYLLDVARATFTFEDPYALSVFFELLKRTFTVVRVKNKLADTEHLEPMERTNVLINVKVDDPMCGLPHIAEVQLILQDFALIKRTLHKVSAARHTARLHVSHSRGRTSHCCLLVSSTMSSAPRPTRSCCCRSSSPALWPHAANATRSARPRSAARAVRKCRPCPRVKQRASSPRSGCRRWKSS